MLVVMRRLNVATVVRVVPVNVLSECQRVVLGLTATGWAPAIGRMRGGRTKVLGESGSFELVGLFKVAVLVAAAVATVSTIPGFALTAAVLLGVSALEEGRLGDSSLLAQL